MSEVRTVAVHRLTGGGSGSARGVVPGFGSGTGFDARTYSLMKHGAARATSSLGTELAHRLLHEEPSLVEDPAPLVLPVAFVAVPPACWFLAEAVLGVLGPLRAARGYTPGRVAQVVKDSVTMTNYASASAASRRAEMDRIGFRLTADVVGAQVLVVDDVRVTGLAERRMLRALDGAGAARTVVAYVAVVDDALAQDPAVESVLNTAEVDSVVRMVPHLEAGDLHLTIRFLRAVLGASVAEREAVLAACPPAVLAAMLAGARATGAAFCASYPEGVRDLEARAAGLVLR